MKRDNFSVGSIVHVYNRGNRKQEIFRDEKDRWYFLQALYYFNNEYSPDNPFQILKKELKLDFYKKLIWPNNWSKRKPLVKILAYILQKNHIHLLLEEIKERGISIFMKKMGNGITNRFNTKYKETGHLFQGSYKAKLVSDDDYLACLNIYIQVKNAMEMYPGGIKGAIKNFNNAYKFACSYRYGSLAVYTKNEIFPILDLGNGNLIKNLIEDQKEFKAQIKNYLSNLVFDEKTMTVSPD